MFFFKKVKRAPLDPILGINTAFAQDKRANKINLGVGTYKTAELKPYVLPSVKKAEKILLGQDLSKEYLAIEGDKLYLEKIKELVLGKESGPATVFQTIGGTAALRVGADF